MAKPMRLPGALPADPAPYLALVRALDDSLPPCHGSPLPTAEDPAQRAEAAARFCPSCPASVFAACHAAGEQESWGVWAGVDRQPGKHGSEAERWTA